MKNVLFILALAGTGVFLSCQKSDTRTSAVQTRTIDVVIDANKTYSFDLGKANQENIQITSQASHASLSRVAIVPGASNSSYQYTPETDFSGADHVVVKVENGEQEHSNGHSCNQPQSGNCGGHQQGGHHGGHNGGKCGKEHDDDHNRESTNYVFNITVNGVSTVK